MATILIIDDESKIRLITRLMLENWGHLVIEAEDGEAGLAMLETERPDLILLDIMLPGMSGWIVCAKIKGDDSLKDIPVIIFTVRASDEDRELSRDCGAEAYLSKPFDMKSLQRTVESVLKN